MKEDIHNFGKRLENGIENLLNSNFFFEEDKEDLKKFYQYLIAEGMSAGRILKYFYHLKTLAKMLGKSFRKASKEEIIEIVGKIERNGEWTDWTKHDFKTVLRCYYKWLYGFKEKGKYPEIVAWIKPKIKNNSKFPEEILNEEEIKKLAEVAYTSRDKAFILALYESGCRIGEFLPLKIKNLEFDEYGAILIVSGKTGDRRIRLVASVLALQKWLEEHPDKTNPEAYIWCKIPSSNNPKYVNEHLSYGFVCKLLRELAKKSWN